MLVYKIYCIDYSFILYKIIVQLSAATDNNKKQIKTKIM